eukprot:g12371.t1
MWGTVAGIAGKGAGFAGQGITRAVNAATYVGEVIAPTIPIDAEESDEDGKDVQDPPACQRPPSSSGFDRRHQHQHQHQHQHHPQQPEESEQHAAKPQMPTPPIQRVGTFEERLRLYRPPAQEETRLGAATESMDGKPATRVQEQQQPPQPQPQPLTQPQREQDLGANLAAHDAPAVSQKSSTGSAGYDGQSGEERDGSVQADSSRTYSAGETLRSSSPTTGAAGAVAAGSLMSPSPVDSEDGGSPSEASPTQPPSAPEVDAYHGEDKRPGGTAAASRDDRETIFSPSPPTTRTPADNHRLLEEASQQRLGLEQEVATLQQRLQAREEQTAQARRQEEASRLALQQELATLRQRLDAREEENVQAHRRLALAEEESASRARERREDELEAESLREQVQSLTEDLEQSQCRESEQSHVNAQLKQVIDQMRQVSRKVGEGAAGHARELEEAVAAKEEAEREVVMLKEMNCEIQAELEQALEETNQRSSSDREMATLAKQLKQAQTRVAEMEAEKRLSEEASAARLTSSQGLHQTALQREQQLGSQVKALTADLALANQDKARHEEALENLRGVLEEFHAERQTDVAVMEKRLKDELAAQASSFEAAKATIKSSYEEQLAEQSRRKQDERLKERRAEAVLEGENARIREELLKSQAALEGALSRLSGERDDMLDRQLVTNLIVRYITARHKRQVLELMARMFSFSEEEKEQVGLSNKGGHSLPGLVTAMLAPAGQDDHKVPLDPERVAGTPLSELWMDFLIAETEGAEGGVGPR